MTDMKKYLNYTLTALALVALVACADEASSTSSGTTPTPEDGKTLIAFSQEGSAMTTRGFTRAGFTASTKVVMRIKAEGKTASDVRYTQAVATASIQTATDDDCNTGYGLSGTHSHLNYAAGMNRYWDDAFGRDTKLTVYAVAVPNKSVEDNVIADDKLNQDGGTNVAPDWYTVATENTKINWAVSPIQTADTRSNEDLVYSNNIRSAETVNKGCYRQTWDGSAWAKSMQLGRMIWQSKDPNDASVTVGQFDKGHLAFKHALSWLTIVLKEGSGFNNASATDFAWTNNNAAADQNITLKGFPTSGKLDLSNGAWSETTSSDITQLHDVTTIPVAAQTTRQLEAYVLPGTVLGDKASNFIEFEIDNAKYYVSGEQIAEAVKSYYSATPTSPYVSFTTTEAGKHYVINLTVSKKGIENITAAILDWETVNSSDVTPDNVYCTFNFEDRNTKLVAADAAKFNIYRAGKDAGAYIDDNTAANYDWKTGYTTTSGTSEVANKATKSWASTTTSWTTDWYWPDNRTYYHFRATGLGDNATSTDNDVTINKDATNGDYFTITSGTLTGSNYRDYVWGAPFTYVDNTYKIKYDGTNGFSLKSDGTTKQISQAIGATNSQINMLLFHMTSQITVNVSSVTGDGSVTLINGDNKTKVEILNFLPDGKVLMGTGAVSASGTRVSEGDSNSEMAYLSESTATTVSYAYGIVPQSLIYDTTGRIGLCITTPDGNKYYVRDLSTCTATVSSTNLAIPYSGSNPYIINAWYPHYKYTYNITLSKVGVTNITAAVLDWETVESTISTPITLEN